MGTVKVLSPFLIFKIILLCRSRPTPAQEAKPKMAALLYAVLEGISPLFVIGKRKEN